MPLLAIFAVANALISSEQRSAITHVLERSFFHQRLVDCGICSREPVRDTPTDPAHVTAFRDWFQNIGA
jgi:hypothetical protein